MKNRTKLMLVGLFSFLVGSAFATLLLISELEFFPFWTIPQEPKADLSISFIYANFTVQNDLPRYDINVSAIPKIYPVASVTFWKYGPGNWVIDN